MLQVRVDIGEGDVAPFVQRDDPLPAASQRRAKRKTKAAIATATQKATCPVVANLEKDRSSQTPRLSGKSS
jgi:hypothetical protein